MNNIWQNMFLLPTKSRVYKFSPYEIKTVILVLIKKTIIKTE